MLPACDVLLCFLFWMTAYGNTLTIGSTVNSTLLDSDIFKGENFFYITSSECHIIFRLYLHVLLIIYTYSV